jgi:pimeloyl-ACP methyl ester carboxylesterase
MTASVRGSPAPTARRGAARDLGAWPNRETSRFLRSGRVDWHVQRAERGPKVLLLHGSGAATQSWRDLAPLLAQDCDAMAPDLPGHGFTIRPRGGLSLPAVARDVEGLMAAEGFVPDLAAGHSAGGRWRRASRSMRAARRGSWRSPPRWRRFPARRARPFQSSPRPSRSTRSRRGCWRRWPMRSRCGACSMAPDRRSTPAARRCIASSSRAPIMCAARWR